MCVCVCVCVCIVQRHFNPKYHSSSIGDTAVAQLLCLILVFIVNGLHLLHNLGFSHVLIFCIVTQGEEINFFAVITIFGRSLKQM